MNCTIDRFENNIAVLVSDDGRVFNIDRASLPEGANEGLAVVVSESDGIITDIRADYEATEAAKKRIRDLFGKIKNEKGR